MFKKWFAKYARAVDDGEERRRLYKKYMAKNILLIVFYVLCAAVIALALSFDAGRDWVVIAFLFALLAWLGTAIACVYLWISFKRAYSSILKRPAAEGEMPEVTAYRQKTVSGKKSALKKLWWHGWCLPWGL